MLLDNNSLQSVPLTFSIDHHFTAGHIVNDSWFGGDQSKTLAFVKTMTHYVSPTGSCASIVINIIFLNGPLYENTQVCVFSADAVSTNAGAIATDTTAATAMTRSTQ